MMSYDREPDIIGGQIPYIALMTSDQNIEKGYHGTHEHKYDPLVDAQFFLHKQNGYSFCTLGKKRETQCCQDKSQHTV